jgi:hypothetical protein
MLLEVAAADATWEPGADSSRAKRGVTKPGRGEGSVQYVWLIRQHKMKKELGISLLVSFVLGALV